MCGISLDCHEMWMPARMVARTVFLMRRGRKEGECQQREGWDPDDRKGRGGDVGWVCWGLLLKLMYVDNL